MGHPAQEATPAREATTEILDVVRNDALWGLVGVEILRVGGGRLNTGQGG